MYTEDSLGDGYPLRPLPLPYLKVNRSHSSDLCESLSVKLLMSADGDSISTESSISESIEYEEEEEFVASQASSSSPSQRGKDKPDRPINNTGKARRRVSFDAGSVDVSYYEDDFEASRRGSVSLSDAASAASIATVSTPSLRRGRSDESGYSIDDFEASRSEGGETVDEIKNVIQTGKSSEGPIPSTEKALRTEEGMTALKNEVIRLRLMQSKARKERQLAAKLRANQRRQQYEAALMEAREKARSSTEESQRLAAQAADLEIKVRLLEKEKAELVSKGEHSHDLLLQAQESLRVMDKRQNEWSQDRSKLLEDNLRANLHTAVLQKSMEANELRCWSSCYAPHL